MQKTPEEKAAFAAKEIALKNNQGELARIERGTTIYLGEITLEYGSHSVQMGRVLRDRIYANLQNVTPQAREVCLQLIAAEWTIEALKNNIKRLEAEIAEYERTSQE